MCLGSLYRINLYIFVSNLLILVLVIFSSRKIVIILNWWSKRGKNGVFLLSLLNNALD